MLNIRKVEWNKTYLSVGVHAFFVIIAAILFEKILGNWESAKTIVSKALGIFAPFFYGFFVAYILSPGVSSIEYKILCKLDRRGGRSRFRRILSILIMYIIVLGFLTLMFAYVVPQIATSIGDLVKNFSDISSLTRNISANITKELDRLNLDSTFIDINILNNIINQNLADIFNTSTNILSNALPIIYNLSLSLTSGLLDLILGLVIAFYILNEKEMFIRQSKKVLYAFFSEEFSDKVIVVGRECNNIFGRFFIGKAIDSLIIGILCYIGCRILGIHYALLISVIVGITNMIPYFGPFIGAVPAVIIELMVDPIKALWVALFILALQQFDGIVLGPKILGDSTGLSPFWVIFAIIVGGAMFGVLGMFLGVPVFAVLHTMFRRWVDKKIKEKKVDSIE